VPVGLTGHRTQRPRGQVGPPRTTPSPAPPWTQMVPGGVKFPLLASLIAQLVNTEAGALVLSTESPRQPTGVTTAPIPPSIANAVAVIVHLN
jgi:hypothetical protein